MTRPRTFGVLVALSSAVLMVGVVPAAHGAAAARIALHGPRRAYVTTHVRLAGSLNGAPDRARVRVYRRTDGRWKQVGTVRVHDRAFHARVRLDRGSNRFRARYRDARDTIRVRGLRAPVRVRLSSQHRVRDERRIRFTIGWHSVDGRGLNGRVRLQSRRRGGRWRSVTVRVSDGTGTIRRRPRHDAHWRVRTPSTRRVRAGSSAPRFVDNVPRGRVIQMPANAPHPRVKLPAQRRAVGKGLNARTQHIGRNRWRRMKGRSWHRGCPVGRSDLRVVRMNYWGFDGYRHRGTMIVNESVARQTRHAFHDLYHHRYPIRAMYPVDRFGWSKKLHGANDHRSMSADNTSAFNCRSVVGKPGVLSPHAYGRSIDLNTWENPYRSRKGLFPNTYWDHRRTPRRVVYRSRSHPVVKAFRRHGFGWLASADWQHFQYGWHGARLRSPHGIFLD